MNSESSHIADDGRPEIVTDRLRLSRISYADAELMLAIWNDPDFITNVRDYGRRTVEDAHKAFDEGPMLNYRTHGYCQFRVALRDDDKAIGTCGMYKREVLDDPDIGFAFLPNYRSKGYAFEAARAVLDHARRELGLGRVTAITSPTNTSSIRLIEKLGLRYSGPILLDGDDTNASLYTIDFAGAA